MALPSAQLVKSALEDLYAAFSNDKTLPGTRRAVTQLGKITSQLNRLYGIPTDVAITDATDASPDNFIATGPDGEGFTAGVTAVGDIFRNTGVGDLTDNALQTAKTAESAGALAAGDIFVMSGADAVAWLANNAGVAFDLDGESRDDFISIGS